MERETAGVRGSGCGAVESSCVLGTSGHWGDEDTEAQSRSHGGLCESPEGMGILLQATEN